MKNFLILVLFVTQTPCKGQSAQLYSEVLAGHRSLMYQHRFGLQLGKNFRFSHLSYADRDFRKTDLTLFNIRNGFDYSITNQFAIQLAMGHKNPGSHVTASVRKRWSAPTYKLSYNLGVTVQSSVYVEHTFTYKQYLEPFKSHKVFTRLLFIANHTKNSYLRGIQQVRFGLERGETSYGLGVNFDQFGLREPQLYNIGFFYAKHFKN